MANLETNFVGLKLKSPIIAGSCSLTADVEKLQEMERQGAGAVILKSIFEEQINANVDRQLSNEQFPEGMEYLAHYVRANDVQCYLDLIKNAKSKLTIPVIASINCLHDGDWTEFAKQAQEAGADALELNMFILPLDEFTSSDDIEESYFRAVKQVKSQVSIPLIVKISPYFTNLSIFVDKLQACGASAVTLFNRFYEPDINIDSLTVGVGPVFSTANDIRASLRWTAILSSKEKMIQISSSTGVHSGEAAIKMLLAGAQTVQICSVMYQESLESISKINQFISEWMDKQMYQSVEEFRGKLSYKNVDSGLRYERAQFMKYFEREELL
ncbi:MAG: dihydroorotate dehydrogenase-like protein [Marinifilaceae bacterium]